ncbi:hypothetical protein TSTA_126590 [Talaromyces stipitatus ATCC 10500]|uniref:Uncharacterized protein n=1 Tax=Talaromyces stipitatus (strain ATCC 10500 / CBS 375.48 / QM 6759 / NRRL 1006) TaxID=441959 RepID=B8MCP9_TALSN|nr:uncharacterized protein TSTA_126590 [Talaromyces stipitatus ATCC 10500]EED18951.1 hypothetical protein TSTA_126590 [Talaromyces stipitatus ATCC 10500]
MIPIPDNLEYAVDPDFWGLSLNLEDEEQHVPKTINTYIAWLQECYDLHDCEGEDLWNTFWEDFEGFTLDLFKVATRPAVRGLRDYLPSAGALSYAHVLYECLHEETQADWTEEALENKAKVIKKWEDLRAKI